MTAKGAKVIIWSPTHDHPGEGMIGTYTLGRFTWHCKEVVANVGTLATFVAHGQYVANVFIGLGLQLSMHIAPDDHKHSSPSGANVVAAAFVKGLCVRRTRPQRLMERIQLLEFVEDVFRLHSILHLITARKIASRHPS